MTRSNRQRHSTSLQHFMQKYSLNDKMRGKAKQMYRKQWNNEVEKTCTHAIYWIEAIGKMKCINKQTSHKTQIESIGDTFSTGDSLSHGQISNWKCHMQNASPWTQFQLSIVLLSSTSHKTDDVIDASIFLRFEITQTTAYDIQWVYCCRIKLRHFNGNNRQ